MSEIRHVGPSGPGSNRPASDGRKVAASRESRSEPTAMGTDGAPAAGEEYGIARRLTAASRRLDDLLRQHARLRTRPDDADPDRIGAIEREISATEIALQNILTVNAPAPDDIRDLLGEGTVADADVLNGVNIGHEKVLELLEG